MEQVHPQTIFPELIVSILRVLRLNREHYTAILLALLGSSALLTFLTSQYGLTASVHKPLAPLSYTAFSLLFLWTTILSIVIFRSSREMNESRRGNLILAGIGCVITFAIIFTFTQNPEMIWRFPSTKLGVLIFGLLSIPVSLLHRVLGFLGMEIPIYLGLLISVPTLLLTWALIISTVSKRMPTRIPATTQPKRTGEPSPFLGSQTSERLLLVASVALAALIRAVPIIIGPLPTGFDTPYYIGTLQGSPKLRWPETAWHRDTPIAYLIFAALGAVFQIPRPLPVSQAKYVELLPVAFHAISALAAYSLTREATGSPRSAVLASLLASSAFSQLRMSFDLYKNILGISALAFSLEAYLILNRRRGKRYFATMLILLCTLLGIHPYPALILILTLSTYALGDYLLSPKRGDCKSTFIITLTLFLTAAVILAPLTYRFLAESPLIDEPWPHQSTTPIFRIPVLTQEGREFFLLTVGAVGFLYCIMKRGSKGGIILSIWFLVTGVMAEQTLFQIFFEAGESEKVPRFIWHLAYPNSILGAIGIVQAMNSLHGTSSPRTKPTPNHRITIKIFVSAMISLLLILHIANAVIFMADYGPMMERSNYNAMIWLDSHSIESSGLKSLYPHHLKQYLWQTHLKAPWERAVVQDLFYLRIYGPEEYDLHATYDRVFDAESVQLYQRSGYFVSF